MDWLEEIVTSIRFAETYNDLLMSDANIDLTNDIENIEATIQEINAENFENIGESSTQMNSLVEPLETTLAELNIWIEYLKTLPETPETREAILDAIKNIVTTRKDIVLADAMHLDARGHIFSHPQLQRYFGLEFQMERFNVSLEKYRLYEGNAFRLRIRREVMQDLRNH